ncbi:MAG TPA: signal recognition particle-docking protein FtsY [Hyphomicrobiales bacterium]|nr:signal recognition particle-docking protein FtsY [Hyphomicrobiales bacterium]
MSDEDSNKGGVFSRWLRRGGDPAPKPAQRPAEETASPAAVEPAPPQDESSPPPATPEHPADAPLPRRGWFTRLTEGLSRTSGQLGRGISDLFTKARLDETTLDDLEDILIRADLGIDTARRITEEVGRQRVAKTLDDRGVRAVVADEIAKALAPVAHPLALNATAKPFVILMAGVNGSGKTTTIGKLAERFRRDGKTVWIAAGDTFRAAAIEQLAVWAERAGATLVKRETGADAAALVFDALDQAKQAGADILLVDTAGRLQNRAELMAELAKVTRVMKKLDPAAPHAALLVLDATVGQNALSQVEAFRDTAGVTGLVMTKLDGTARGGILVAVAAKFGLPVHFIGVGEGVDDLAPFDAAEFGRALVGLDAA